MPSPLDESSSIAAPLRKRIANDPTALYRVLVDLDLKGITRSVAYEQFKALLGRALKDSTRTEQHIFSAGDDLQPYITARLQGQVILDIVALDSANLTNPDTKPVIAFIRIDTTDGRNFNPDNMVRTVISTPMLRQIESDESADQSVLIEVNVNYPEGRTNAKARVRNLVAQAIADTSGSTSEEFVSDWKTEMSEQYVYAVLNGRQIQRLVELDQLTNPPSRAIYHIWPDFKVRAQIWRSASTVKADACRRAFATTGRGIVWAVFDSGIDGNHPHFLNFSNLELPNGLAHLDFTGPVEPEPIPPALLTDPYGHGTHVAGIIAGGLKKGVQAKSLLREKDQTGKITYRENTLDEGLEILGVAPECKLLSYRVLDKNGEGSVSTLIAAIQKVQELNGYGRNLLIHGVNMSLGYDFDPEWFACGQSPVCVEVDRLVRSGVAVVIAAGNTGKGFALTINDPGNAELAITVGATHRDMPHRYGVSYFSSKGPTGDGRCKPDLLAPGERILSCGAGPDLLTYRSKAGAPPSAADSSTAFYLERSGTSMAAPHVSGIIAGILSMREEFVGLPETLKERLISNATDLGRDRNFQGGGLVDMMRTIQSV